MPTTMTIRLEAEMKDRLDQLAEATHRSKSYLVTQVIRDFVALNEWQIREIQEGVKEADAGDFASEETVNKVLGKWSIDAN